MAAANFKRALAHVLVHEGGYVNHPADPGGATNKGVTQKVYDGYRVRRGRMAQSVRHISADEVEEIYKLQYWDAIKGDELPDGLDYVVFDGAVNSGPSRSAIWLQQALGLRPDGVIGEQTLRAVDIGNPPSLIDSICDIRMDFLRRLSTFGVFGVGWTRRVSGVRAVGKEWAIAKPPRYVAPDIQALENGGFNKAKPEDISVPRTNEGKGIGITGLGTVGATITDLANSMHSYIMVSNVLKGVFIALTVLGIVITVYSLYKKAKAGGLA